jgi:tRNA threonylcarbamoyladenosine biosynthesis protein TsaE
MTVLTGEMGVGKTALCSAIINSFFPNIIATSPTFNLVNIYNDSACIIHHYDLYRLNTLGEVLNIGIEESFAKAITLIEWPDIIKSILPKDIINIDIINLNNSRYISLQDNRT